MGSVSVNLNVTVGVNVNITVSVSVSVSVSVNSNARCCTQKNETSLLNRKPLQTQGKKKIRKQKAHGLEIHPCRQV